MLSDAKYFSVLDATSGYWHIKLDKESSLQVEALLTDTRFTSHTNSHSRKRTFP